MIDDDNKKILSNDMNGGKSCAGLSNNLNNVKRCDGKRSDNFTIQTKKDENNHKKTQKVNFEEENLSEDVDTEDIKNVRRKKRSMMAVERR